MINLKSLSLVFSLFISFQVFAQTSKPAKKVVFIIVDGIAEDMLNKADIPNIKRIAKDGALLPAYVGGGKGTYSQTPTISAVGYNSLLTGTWVNKHNVYNNYNQKPNYHYPTIFRVFKDEYPQKKIAVFSTWEDNRTVLIGENLEATKKIKMDYAFDGLEKDTVRFPHDAQHRYTRKIDSVVSQKAAAYIKTEAPDLSWVYLQYTDDMGHRHGDGPILYEAISFEDKNIGEIYDAVKYREAHYNEDWLFIVTTDHGRKAKHGKGHGGQSPRERQIWIAINQPNLNQYARTNRVPITDLFPTMAHFLDIKIPHPIQREIDGVDLLQKIAAYDLKATLKNNKLNLTWKTTKIANIDTAQLYITYTNRFKKGGTDTYQLLGSVPLSDEKFTTTLAPHKKSKLYKITLETDDGILNTWIKK